MEFRICRYICLVNETGAERFNITSFIVIVLPGTGVFYTMSTGITKGRKASFIAALGWLKSVQILFGILFIAFAIKMLL